MSRALTLRSLCRDCHQGEWAVDKRGFRTDIGDDGLPIDPSSPVQRWGKSGSGCALD
jgi:hypothetical protein